MIRTRHTIQLIIEILGLTGKIEVLEEALLLSRSKGLLEGMMKTDIEKFYPNEIQDRKNDPWNYTPLYGGESRKSAYNRIKKFIKKYKDESNLVICTHSGIVKTLKNILSGLSEEDIKTLVKEKSEEKIQSYFYAWDGNNIAKI
jgi:broad specificity phosphatase PhoE